MERGGTPPWSGLTAVRGQIAYFFASIVNMTAAEAGDQTVANRASKTSTSTRPTRLHSRAGDAMHDCCCWRGEATRAKLPRDVEAGVALTRLITRSGKKLCSPDNCSGRARFGASATSASGRQQQ